MKESEAKKLLKAEPGTSVVYHEGQGIAGAIALEHIRRLYDEGRVDLAQRRSSKGFQYIVQFRRKPTVIPDYGTFKFAGLLGQ